MIQQQTDSYIKVCMKSWLLCESCIHSELNSFSPRQQVIDTCNLCAKACFAVVTRLVSNPQDLEYLPFNCMLDCIQCAEECKKYSNDPDMEDCADVCLICAEKMKDLAIFSLN